MLHNALWSGTEKALDSAARRAKSWIMVRHPSTGQNLLMAGDDLLDAPTGTAVATWSETGQGILGTKEDKGMWVWSAVVLAVLSSRMSAGGSCGPCLVMTAAFTFLPEQKNPVLITECLGTSRTRWSSSRMAVGGENTVGYGALNSSDENGIQRREPAGAIFFLSARRLMLQQP